MCSSKAKLVSNTNGAVRAPLLERRNNADASGLFLRSKTTDDEPKPGPSPSPRLKSLNKSKSFSYSVVEYEAGSIAAARREEVASFHERRRMRIAHYGRTAAAAKPSKAAVAPTPNASNVSEKRCTFITPNSDPIYVAYHDEEWGVPVHNDEKLFELLVLTGAQVGSDWTAVLKKRQDFKDAFSGFDVEVVSKYSEKKMIAISSQYRIELSHVRGAVDNAKRILQIWDEVGSLDKYLWGFVNDKAIATAYKLSNKIPVKTSKSETISKDMVRRGFRQVGPTVIHSFMQAAGLTNDHLLTCPRHSQILHLHSLYQN
ncbi:probable GMP synthase [glutamine-hydrolyzing] [Salvia hispanica]|uniref:probable GMP synthase [glutamine-hydrolyzing] n=1 Tax=Salvia hispanica TaxID=49212 RepID=UPI002009CB3A|nr:probable GMP synthase [glutamine-hydrolyzing] [Salvia hispanica]